MRKLYFTKVLYGVWFIFTSDIHKMDSWKLNRWPKFPDWPGGNLASFFLPPLRARVVFTLSSCLDYAWIVVVFSSEFLCYDGINMLPVLRLLGPVPSCGQGFRISLQCFYPWFHLFESMDPFLIFRRFRRGNRAWSKLIVLAGPRQCLSSCEFNSSPTDRC